MKKEKYCIDCGKKLSKNPKAKRCGSCAQKINMLKLHKEGIAGGFKKSHTLSDGKKNPFFGKHHTEKTKEKLSTSKKEYYMEYPEKHPWLGKNHSGRNNPNWRGGRDVYLRRRRGLGFIPLNDWFPGCEAHHIDKEFVIHIPKEMHRSIYHSVTQNINMEKINALAIDFCYGD